MAHPSIATYARLADGSAGAIRTIEGQGTLFGRSIHDFGYDPVRDELYVYLNHLDAVAVYKADAEGAAAPIRMMKGPKMQMGFTNGRIALDPVHREVFIPVNGNSVLVFPQFAEGDVAPIRVLKGPDTQLDRGGATAITIDPVHNLLIVSGRSMDWMGKRVGSADLVMYGTDGLQGSMEGGSVGQIAIYDRTASGNAKPLRVITGSKTMLTANNQTLMTNYPPRGLIIGAVAGSYYGEIAEYSTNAFVGVWSIYDNGDVAPRWTIGGPNGILRQSRGITLDPKNKALIVSDKSLNAVLTFEFPEMF